MNDPYDSDEDFVLPPLPSKPQKSITAFFGGKKSKTKSKSQGQTKQDNNDDKAISNEAGDMKTTSLEEEKITDHGSQDLPKSSESKLSAELNVIKMEPARAPFPKVNHTVQDPVQVESAGKINKMTKYLNEEEIQVGTNFQWSSLVPMKEKEKEVLRSDDIVSKPIEKCLEELESNYPDIPVRKVFQQYLVSQKKVVMSDLKKVQASKQAVESIWNKQSIIEESERLAKVEKMKADELRIKAEEERIKAEEELARRNEGKDIRKMFSKKPKRPASKKVVQNEETENNNKNEVESSSKETKISKDKEKKKDSGKGEKAMAISVAGLFGKKKDRPRRKSRKNEDNESDIEEKKGDEVDAEVENFSGKVKDRPKRKSRRTIEVEDGIDEKCDKLATEKDKGNGGKSIEIEKKVESRKRKPTIIDEENDDDNELSTSGKNDQESSQKDKEIENFFGKTKNQSRRKPRRIEDSDESDVEVKERKMVEDENSTATNEGRKAKAVSDNVDSQEQAVDMEIGDEITDGKAVDAVEQSILCDEDETIEPERKRKKKNKKGLSFLKIKFVETAHSKDKEEKEIEDKVHSKDIRSMFAKAKKVKDVSAKVEKVEVNVTKDNKSDESSKNDTVMETDVDGKSSDAPQFVTPHFDMVQPLPTSVEEAENPNDNKEQQTIDAGKEIDERRDSECTEPPSSSTKKAIVTESNIQQDVIKKEVVSKAKVNLFSYFSKSRKSEDSKKLKKEQIFHDEKEEGVNDKTSIKSGKVTESGQTESDAAATATPDSLDKTDKNSVTSVDIQPKETVEKLLDLHEKAENDMFSSALSVMEKDEQKDFITPNVTPCKIQLNRIASPTPCSVKIDDILTVISDNSTEKTNNRKRKRSNSQSLLTSNKAQKQNELANARRGLRKRGKPQDVTILGDTLAIESEPEIRKEESVELKLSSEKTTVIKSEPANEPEDEKENSQQSKSLRRSSRSRKVVNYNESALLSEAIEAVSQSVSEKKASKKPKLENITKAELDESVCIVGDVKKEEIETEVKSMDLKDMVPTRDLCFPESSKKTRPIIDLVLDEITMNSFLSWTDKYQPIKARHVIGDKHRTKELFTWLCSWKEKHESIVKKMAARAMKASKRRGNADSDSDFDSSDSDEEELLSNTLVLTGPTGCGTTAAVLACAKQMDFKVLELNPSIYRTGKHMFDLVSEAVVSHRVHKNISTIQGPSKGGVESFFKSSGTKSEKKEKKKKSPVAKQDIMALVLVEQADIVYEEQDKGFWQGLYDLRRLAKRPMILTANDDRIWPLVHTDENQHTEKIQLDYPNAQQILPMMQIMCLVERVYVPTPLLLSIIEFCRNDVRQIILQLQFWFEQGQSPLYKSWKKDSSNNDDACVVDEIDKVATEKSDVTKEQSEKTKENTGETQENTDVMMDKTDVKSADVTKNSADGAGIGKSTVENSFAINVDVTMENPDVVKTSDNTTSLNDADVSMESIEDTCCLTENTGVSVAEASTIAKNNGLTCSMDNNVVMETSNAINDGTRQNDDKTNIHGCVEENERLKEKLTAIIAPFDRLPLFEEEEKILDMEKINTTELKCSQRCFTFTKPRKSRDKLSDISDVIENLSEVDAFLHTPKYRKTHKDNFIRSTMIDSLSDEFWKEKGNGHIYPNKCLCTCVRKTMNYCYGCISERNLNEDYTTSKRAWTFRDLYDDISSHLPLSSRLDRENIPMHVKPYLTNICLSEESRKTSQRRQRRFLHYLDTNRIFLDESAIGLLKENSFLSPSK